ncbi:Peptidase S1 domain-containing protein [Aphelenchoides fujianensis]|nr:Peptidase S1 domain-containing protein [Aphelenchoides fujianensis]
MRTFQVAVCFFLVLPFAASILGGDPLDWDRHTYLVKVVNRGANNTLKSCTGVLISSSLVLTASECVLDATHHPAKEINVLLNVRNSSRRELAILLDRNERWAALKIPPIDVRKICPTPPEPRGILRLNLRPSLSTSSLLEVSVDEILNSRCYLVGFETAEKPEDFYANRQIGRLELEPLKSSQQEPFLFRSESVVNETACFDDAGAPMICDTTAHGTILVGLFQKLGIPADRLEAIQPAAFTQRLEHCNLAQEMLCSLFNNELHLIDLLERHDYSATSWSLARSDF